MRIKLSDALFDLTDDWALAKHGLTKKEIYRMDIEGINILFNRLSEPINEGEAYVICPDEFFIFPN